MKQRSEAKIFVLLVLTVMVLASSLTACGPNPRAQSIVWSWKYRAREIRSDTILALGKFGPVACPILVWMLGNEKTDWPAAQALEDIGPGAVPALIQALEHKNKDVRRRAARTLASIGSEAASAIPVLIRVLEDEHAGEAAAYALSRIGPEAVPYLVQSLNNRYPNARANAAWALGRIGALGYLDPVVAGTVVSTLIQALRDKSPIVRANAAGALGTIGPKATKGVPVLIWTLRDESPRVCANAAYALGKIGPGAIKGIPALIRASRDENPSVRGNAVWALGRIDPFSGVHFHKAD